MFRRIVSLLLLPGVMLTQSAVGLSHSHGDNEPAGHGLRAHIHIHGCSHSHELVHHHFHAEEVVESNFHRDDHPNRPSETEHDADAVYVKTIDSLVRSYATIGDTLRGIHSWISNTSQAIASAPVCPRFPAVDQTHPPPPCGYDCPLYLWQLALLI